MVERYEAMTPRAKALAAAVLLLLAPLGGWIGYSIGYWAATH